jgi:hypothetical protein
LYIKPINITQKLLELINQFSKVSGYKINLTKKKLLILYTETKLFQQEIKKAIPFEVALKILRRPGMVVHTCKLSQEVENGQITAQGQQRQKVSESLSQQT